MTTIHAHLSSSSTLSPRVRGRAALRLGAIVSTAALLGACGVAPEGGEGPLGVAASALCPAPGATVSFAAPEVLYQTGGSDLSQPAHGVSADFTGDGLLDAVFLDGGSHRLTLFAGNGSGLGLARISTLSGLGAFYNPQGAAALDSDGDGDMDIAYVAQGGSALILALNDGHGAFSTGPTVTIPATYGIKRLAVGDFDGDGRPDLAITANVTRRVQVVLNKATGLLLLPAITTGNAAPWDIASADLDLDGKLDLVVGVAGVPQPFLVYRGDGTGAFTPAASPAPRNQGTNGASTVGLVVGDLDGDGLADAAYVESATRAVHFFRNTSTAAGVSFASEAASGNGPLPLPELVSDIVMAPGDIDADGRMDLAVIGKLFGVGARLYVERNDGAPGAPLAFASAGGPWFVSPGGKTSATPRGMVAGAFDVASCGARSDLVFSSSNTTTADWSVQFVRNTTE